MLVAAGSVVTKSIPPRCVVGGNPVRFICTIEEFRDKNLNYNTHTYNKHNKRNILQSLPDSKLIKK